MSRLKCIFHIPWKLAEKQNVASEIRPRKMLKAFMDYGYEVDTVWGDSRERKEKINNIKNKIKHGIKYDFMYSESSTLPNALTDYDHLPRSPFADYFFFRFCKKNSIPVGLFYRDVYWNISGYRRFNPLLNSGVNFFHKLDNFLIFPLLKKLYLPSEAMKPYVPFVPDELSCKALPSGVEPKTGKNTENNTFLYVGNVNDSIYDISVLFKVFSKIPEAELIVNCRETSNEFIKKTYKEYLTDNIKVKNYFGSDLVKLYDTASYAFLFFKPDIVRTFASPYKQFEYISYCKITIANIETHAGKFNRENNLGFSIKYDENELAECVKSLLGKDHAEIKKQIKKFADENTWLKRAETVINDLRS
ncbi:MAG: glycosyltransferase [Candidatus Cloacimonadota bacterium]|nr:MAG: glycosyltransferase [Candidatus Cloacimonadota bacterium]